MRKSLKKRYSALIDLGITDQVPEKDRQKFRLINQMTLTMALVGIPFVIYVWIAGIYYHAIVLTSGVVGASFNLYLTSRYKNVKVSSHFLLILMCITFVLTNLRSGGFINPHFSWTYIIPVVAGLLLGRSGMLFYLLVQTIITVVFYQVWVSGFELPNVIAPEHQGLLALFNRISVVVTLSFIVLGFVLEREFIERQLVKAKHQAEAGSRAKSEFLATMSHEIRTPLNGVLGMAELMGTTALSQDQARFLNSIRNSSRSLLAVLNDVLDYSKIEAGKMEIENLRFNLEHLISEAVSLFALRSAQSGIELIVYIDPSLPPDISADPTRIKQVLINLLGNAFKFTEAGEVHLVVTKNYQSLSEFGLKFEVIDTGIGISPQKQLHLFDSFSQVDASTTRKYGGSGLGLAICRRMLRLMGGDIGVDSAENFGSTFWFTLPVNVNESAGSIPLGYEELIGKRIILADSSRTRSVFVQKALRYYGVDVEFVKSKESIKSRLLAATVDDPVCAVLVDEKFAAGNGARILDEISSLKEAHAVKLILLDELTVLQFPQRKSYEHIDYIIEKPLLIHKLLSLLLHPNNTIDLVLVKSVVDENLCVNFRVLIVEDNEINQAVIEGVLNLLNIDFALVTNGQEALDYLQAYPDTIDMIFMDCEMPVMDGIEATRRIRALDYLDKHKARLPIIALSAHAFEEKKQEAYLAGMDYFLTKPVEIEVIAKVISLVAQGHLSELTKGDNYGK